MTDDAIVVEGLEKSYGSVRALCGVDFAARTGQRARPAGPQRCRQDHRGADPDHAAGARRGHGPGGGTRREADAAELRATIGLAGQYAAVDENLTGFENLEMVGRLYHLGKGPARKRADELLERFDLTEAAKRPVKTYSGGMRRRLDLAAALVARPPVLFLDEPTTGLDPRSRLGMWETIEARVAAGTTVLLTTQYLDEADRLADQIVVIDHGTRDRRGHVRRAEGPASAASGSRSSSRTAPTSSRDRRARPRCAGDRRDGRGQRRPRARAAAPRRHPRRRPQARRASASRSTTSRCAARRSTTCSSPSPATPPRNDGAPDEEQEEVAA